MSDTSKKLVYMANQIATFFASQPEKDAATNFADHINKFWDPRMRATLFEMLDKGGEDLLPLVTQAAPRVRRPKTQNN